MFSSCCEEKTFLKALGEARASRQYINRKIFLSKQGVRRSPQLPLVQADGADVLCAIVIP